MYFPALEEKRPIAARAGLRQFSRVGYLEFSELTGFAGWWVGDSVSSRFARMQVSDFAVGGGWWVQDHGWLAAGWLAGWMHLRARMRACIHPAQPRARMHNWADSRCTQIRSCTAVCMRSLRLSQSVLDLLDLLILYSVTLLYIY